MSATQFIEQIPSLPDEDIRQVEAALRRRRVEAARKTGVQGGVRPGFEKIVQKVFTNHEELLRKLAQ